MADSSQMTVTNLAPASSGSDPRPPTCYFLELPAELRNRIYDLLLIPGGTPIQVCDPDFSDTPSGVYPNILFTNRTSYEEATPILYAANTLRITSVVDIPEFFNVIDKHIHHLRKVEVSWMNRPDRASVQELQPLRRAKSLQSLHLTDVDAHEVSEAGMATNLLPLAQAFEKEDGEVELVDILRIKAQTTGVYRRNAYGQLTNTTLVYCEPQRVYWEKRWKEYEGEMQNELRKLLES